VSYDAVGNETLVGSGSFAYSSRNNLSTGDGLTYTYDGRGVRTVVRDASGNKRYFFYTPELSLLAETTLAPNPSTTGGYEYVWFNGHPAAEENGGTHWTFTDHLGTPLLLTDSTGTGIFWRVEYEPYGRVFTLRTSDQHQPLRFPGQEAEQLNFLPNGRTERDYNIFRWYRYGWGRYSQVDPILNPPVAAELFRQKGSTLFATEGTPFAYAGDNPVFARDPFGLCPCDSFNVKLYYTPDSGRGYPDYHWYRQDSNGGWSSKHGWEPVGPQVDPDEDAAATGYGVFCANMCVVGAAPVYNPKPWNDPQHIHTNNCYSYGCDLLYPPGRWNKPQPGSHPLPRNFKCADVINAAEEDGLTIDQ